MKLLHELNSSVKVSISHARREMVLKLPAVFQGLKTTEDVQLDTRLLNVISMLDTIKVCCRMEGEQSTVVSLFLVIAEVDE